MRLHVIVAIDDDYNMVFKDKIPWTFKDGITHFKKMTLNNIVVMGRKTYDSIGKSLKNRINVVFTSDEEILSDEKLGLYYVSNMSEYYALLPKIKADRDVFVIGGRQIYDLFLPYADRIIIAHVKGHFDNNIKFPSVDLSKWKSTNEIKRKDFTIKYYSKFY